MKKVTCFLLFFAFLSGCSQMTTTTRQTESGKEIAIGQFAPKAESGCTMVHNEELTQSLLQRYTDEGALLGFYADSEKTLSIAEAKSANYVHIYLPPKKMLFGIVDLNYNDKPRATYYQCKHIPFQ
ncbi:hypothetical protein [Endozoicomonas elysicola]|uniref:Lipoprotein n=1 Tax=Endozoicomonas elysicola TaxID=305900 RepID=A0A081KEW1_9GAMM|nr:hypothetical protein [Endozoicomonas elysicola]KEI72687.1 hypothetical protein GV64_19915 [Endozoicomonas elysicola]